MQSVTLPAVPTGTRTDLAYASAVAVLCRGVLPAGVRPLGAEEGFPPLPTASITLHRGRQISAVAECLAGYMREGFNTDVSLVTSNGAASRAVTVT